MALEVRHNPVNNTHENRQFRRVARYLRELFDKNSWEGVLIGNPESENFANMRADAILLYDHGLILIDFKDYAGRLEIPISNDRFYNNSWNVDSQSETERIVLRAGKSFANPFRQLKYYREKMFDLISTEIKLNKQLDPTRICALNIFSGPLEIAGRPPGKFRYYDLVDEAGLAGFLYDYRSTNSYSRDVADGLLKHFPAELWEDSDQVEEYSDVDETVSELQGNLEDEIEAFLQSAKSGILVLESMNSKKRDEWLLNILSKGTQFNIPQIEAWTHSSRISRRIKNRSNISTVGLYNTIYGGKPREESNETEGNSEEFPHKTAVDPNETFATDNLLDEQPDSTARSGDEKVQETSEEGGEDSLEVVAIRSDKDIDEKAVIILQEAHLVTRSLHQSELLRFGTGRLLEDLLTFLDLEKTNRKLICIGDPYSLSYGKEEESALSLETLKNLFPGSISHYRATPAEVIDNAITHQRMDLATSIETDCFNKLKYYWAEELRETKKSEVFELFRAWFSKPLTTEPSNAALLYSRNDANLANHWIKTHCLKNSNYLAPDDLLLLDNNISIPDDAGLGVPRKLYNGMYVLVREVLNDVTESIWLKGSKKPVLLNFLKLRVQCLSLENKPQVELWFSQNYFESLGKLSRAEIIAFRILVNNKIKQYKENHPFESSFYYSDLQKDNNKIRLSNEIKDLEEQLESGERVKGKLEKAKTELRKLNGIYKKYYDQQVRLHVVSQDPILNAINANYGWCITVHKAVGALFNSIVINVDQGEGRGYHNPDYYRWLYSGLTTAKSKVYISNPIEFDPFSKCYFEDMVGEGWHEPNNTRRMVLEFSGYTSPENLNQSIHPDLVENSKAAISIFSEAVAQVGLQLERTAKFGDYISKAYYSVPENGQGQLIMVFNNNGLGQVTSIRPERNGELYHEAIQQSVDAVHLAASENDLKNEASAEDFRKDLYDELNAKCISRKAELNLIASHDYQDVFILSKEGEKVKFKLVYNGLGMFTHAAVIQKTSTDISILLQDLIFNAE